MSLRLVPFNSAWIDHQKLDLHAIYRRPRYVTDEFGEVQREYKDGLPTWDLTAGLPVRQHTRWMAKGFEYVTLSNRESLQAAFKHGTIQGSYRDYDQHQTGGPWNYKKYYEGLASERTAEMAQIRSAVEKYGPDAYEEIRRATEPSFRLPAELKQARSSRDRSEDEPAVASIHIDGRELAEVVAPPRRRGRPRKVQPSAEVA